ncbi:MAG: hypothetical protein FWD76_00135, partial [Firmicutes bacterium]|nr:hypothetical protein [Bacillota bacterium]
MKNILCINDLSCYAHCSLAVAMPVLAKYGHRAVALPTALFSTHTGVEGFCHFDTSPFLQQAQEHFEKLGLQFDWVYSGFLGTTAQVDWLGDLFAKTQKQK